MRRFQPALPRPMAWVPGLLVGAFLLAACDSASETGTGPDRTQGESSVSQTPETGADSPPEGATVRELAADVLTYQPPEPAGRSEGELSLGGAKSVPAQLEVLEVTSTQSSTVLYARLTSPQQAGAVRGSLSQDRDFDPVNGISLTAGEQTYFPAEYEYGPAVLAQHCVCTEVIRGLGPEGVYVYAAYEALPLDISTVTVQAPGFEPLEVEVAQRAGSSG